MIKNSKMLGMQQVALWSKGRKNLEEQLFPKTKIQKAEKHYFYNKSQPIQVQQIVYFAMISEATQARQHLIRDDDKDQNDLIELFLKPDAPKIVRVIAAPGSGKTTTICRLLKHMYLESVKPLYPNFLVLTFTRRTRIDLVRKINELVGLQSRKDYVCSRVRNFHSLANSLIFWSKIIQEEQEKEIFDELSQSLVYPAESSQKYDKQVAKSIAWKTIHKIFAQAYTEEEKDVQLQKLKNSHKNRPAYQLIVRYMDWLEEAFRDQKKITFDYAIIKAIEYIDAKKKCYGIDLDNLDLIIVDQFQDSNPAQVKLIASLMKRSKKDIRLLMIGDYDQNIYSWRGAKISSIQSLIESEKWHSMFLRRTYRLSQSVTNICQRLIISDPHYREFRQKFYKGYELQAMNKRDHPVVVQQFDSEYSEVRWVVDKLYEHLEQGAQPKDITILCREFKNIRFYQKLKFQLNRQKLIRGKQIPYDYQHFKSAMARKEGLYLLAILQYFYKVQHLKHHKGDKSDIKRILQLKNIGEKDEVWLRIMQNQKIDKVSQKYFNKPKKLKLRQQSWDNFFIDFDKIKEIMRSKLQIREALELITQVLTHSSWFNMEMLESCVVDFIDAIEEYAETIDKEEFAKEPTFSIVKKMMEENNQEVEAIDSSDQEGDIEEEKVLERKKEEKNKKQQIPNSRKKQLAMKKQLDLGAKRNRVTIQSIHNSKGLEYPIVFLCALGHGYFQSAYEENPMEYKSLGDAERERRQNFERDSIVEKMSQELRLIYTAITRTSGHVYVSASKNDSLRRRHYPPLPPHPVFETLKEICGCKQTIPFNHEKDGASKTFIELQLKRIVEEKNKKAEKKKAKQQKAAQTK